MANIFITTSGAKDKQIYTAVVTEYPELHEESSSRQECLNNIVSKIHLLEQNHIKSHPEEKKKEKFAIGF